MDEIFQPDMSSMQPQPDMSSMQPQPDMSSMQPQPDMSSMQPQPDMSSMQPQPDMSSMAPPPGASPSVDVDGTGLQSTSGAPTSFPGDTDVWVPPGPHMGDNWDGGVPSVDSAPEPPEEKPIPISLGGPWFSDTPLYPAPPPDDPAAPTDDTVEQYPADPSSVVTIPEVTIVGNPDVPGITSPMTLPSDGFPTIQAAPPPPTKEEKAADEANRNFNEQQAEGWNEGKKDPGPEKEVEILQPLPTFYGLVE